MPLQFLPDIPLAQYTSFQVGGPARWFCAPASEAEFREARAFATERGLETFILGKGTNMVFSDAGYDGLLVYTGNYARIFWDGHHVIAQCGALLMDVVSQSVERGMIGMQNMAGIPGTVGGGIYINAGAFDQEFKDVVSWVLSLSPEGEKITRLNAECGFAYRRSDFVGGDEIILNAELRLRHGGDIAALTAQMNATLARRAEKQPLHLPNAGSMFKRPPGNYAGVLIEGAGLKGFRMGGAGISDKHANFTVNNGGATAQDIWDLTSEVILRVKANSGITLEREPIFTGAFLPWPR